MNIIETKTVEGKTMPDSGMTERGEEMPVNLKPTMESLADELSIRYAYLYLLGRDPENEEVVRDNLAAHQRVGSTIRQVRTSCMNSGEYKLIHGLGEESASAGGSSAAGSATASSASGAATPQTVSAPPVEGQATPRPLLFLGGCILDNLVAHADSLGSKTDLIVYHGYLHEPPPAPARWDYDAVIFSPVLRHLLRQAAERIGGWTPDGDLFPWRDVPLDQLRDAAVEILDAVIAKLREAVPPSIPLFLLAFLEPPPTDRGVFQTRRGFYRLVRDLNDHLAERAEAGAPCLYLEINDLLRRHGDENLYDGYIGWYAHASLRGGGHSVARALFERIDEMLRALRGTETVKLIITDLDGTLWNGVLAERDEILPGEMTEGWPLACAEALLICKRRGIVLAVCSKNDEETIRQNFDRVWLGRLKLDDFASVRINWRPKSENIAEILAEVNVLPEHAVFIDDNPLEVAEVQRAFPQMKVLSPQPWTWRPELIMGGRFQVPRISAESERRTELIRARVERERALGAGDREAYLRDLGMRLEIRRLSPADPVFARALELINKTNQFNTTGRRWQEGELAEALRSGFALYALRAEDRLANHGWVSMALLEAGVIVQWVFSCRVFGVGLEEAFLHVLQKDHPRPLRALWRETGKNAVAREFLHRHFIPDGEGLVLRETPPWPAHLTLLEERVTA